MSEIVVMVSDSLFSIILIVWFLLLVFSIIHTGEMPYFLSWANFCLMGAIVFYPYFSKALKGWL
jgi:hypothetical protein